MASEVVSSRQIKLRDYRYPGEVLSLILTFIVIFGIYAVATIYYPSTWSTTLKTLVITFAGLAVYIVTVILQQRAAFGTMVRVGPRQFPELYEITVKSAENLSSRLVPVYVKRSSEMNIYTLGFWQQPIIVLTSSLIDQMQPDNLQFFIGREIGHVQAGHTWLRTLLKPLGADVPIFGKLLNSVIFGDWINRAELTADRAGFISCRSLTTSIITMLKFGVGIRLFEKLDIKEFLDQIKDVRNVRGHLTEIVAEQPYLTQRIRALVRFSLSDQFRSIVPGKSGHTSILSSIPEAFVSSRLDLSDLDSIGSVVSEKAIKDQKQGNVYLDDVITITDFEIQDAPDENGIDQRLALVAKSSGEKHSLRRLRTRIGRNNDNDIVLNNDRVSRYHAEIVRNVDEYRIVDVQSRNGMLVNGRRVDASAPIKSGDVIRIGREDFIFQVKE